jgi:hypothetical protein
MKSKFTLPNASSKYGAQMGRSNVIPSDRGAAYKLQMQRLKWVDGDYDEQGAYWGRTNGDFIYCAHLDNPHVPVLIFVRAKSRVEAKELIRKELPYAGFYR